MDTLATATADQPTLDGIPPAPPAVAHSLRIGVAGRLQHDARVFTLPDGRACLQAVVAQHVPAHPQACPVLASVLYPPGAAGRHDADAVARTLYAGTPVVLVGTGLEPGTHHGAPVLRLLHCIGVVPDVAPSTGA
jgi:hypothetical protein